MNSNSLLAYETSIKPHLTRKQLEVLLIYESGERYTDEQVAQLLGVGINHVSGRVGELLRKNCIVVVGHDTSKGRRRICQLAKRTLF